MQAEESVNVVVVGGGAAGLAAAVAAESRGLTCQVLEARDRLGGRVFTTSLSDDERFDRGAQMVNADMVSVLELAEAANLPVLPIPGTGISLRLIGEDVCRDDELISAEEIYEVLDGVIVSYATPEEQLDAVRQKLTWWTTPWESPGEAWRWLRWVFRRSEAPAESVAAALGASLLCREDHALARSIVTEGYSAAPEDLDARALRIAMRRETSDRNDMEFQFPDGMGGIIDYLSSRLHHVPRLRTAVSEVKVGARHVDITTNRGKWRADAVIVTAPPPAARHISFFSERAEELSELLASFQTGAVIKMQLSYRHAFWRRRGLSGSAVFSDPAGMAVVDTSLDTGAPPRLTAFLGGPEARIWAALPADQRHRRLMSHLSRAFGSDAQRPTQIVEAAWIDDMWSGGGYNATVRVGGAHDAALRLSRWSGRLRFAGAELGAHFAGYVEGAIRSGREAAENVADEIAGSATRQRYVGERGAGEVL
ncbi:MAG: NAD(P)/FAD-dependent oxidoreductase [Pseudomonadota bacterium]